MGDWAWGKKRGGDDVPCRKSKTTRDKETACEKRASVDPEILERRSALGRR